jgi:hypothetical protein
MLFILPNHFKHEKAELKPQTMTDSRKHELLMLLQERTLSNFERRKRRLQTIPMSVVTEALLREQQGLPLNSEQFIAINLGFVPGERESKKTI